MQQIFRDIEVRVFVWSCGQVTYVKFSGLISKLKILEKSYLSPQIFNVETCIWYLFKANKIYGEPMKPSELFFFKDTKNFAVLLFFLAVCNKKFQWANVTEIT